jgi:uncharacterized FAD-dependent dehydrogenase
LACQNKIVKFINYKQYMEEFKKIIIVGSGVSGISAATKLVDNGYPGDSIIVIDKGNDPYNRLPEEVMTGMLGAGGWSDGKLTYHTAIGGQLSKYCGDEKAMSLMDEVINNFRRFHPQPEEIFCSDPQAEPEFIKPYFGLRLFPVWHIGSNYLHEIAKNWYQYLLDKGVRFFWNSTVHSMNLNEQTMVVDGPLFNPGSNIVGYDYLILAAGKSGIDFAQQIAENHQLPTEPKSVQIGVRFEAPQLYFQQLIDISYDFKLYKKYDNVSLRTFCTNNNAAYVAVESTYGDVSYNGHAKKGEEFRNNMTNFGILMEIKGIENPFEWSREAVKKLQINGTGIYYSPNRTRTPSSTSEGVEVSAIQVDTIDPLFEALGEEYAQYIEDFITEMQIVFPEMGDDWGIYMPEVKYVSPEPLVNYNNLSLINHPTAYFVGDVLSARGITVAGSQGIYVAEDILNLSK